MQVREREREEQRRLDCHYTIFEISCRRFFFNWESVRK
jgi:hypothetical protein